MHGAAAYALSRKWLAGDDRRGAAVQLERPNSRDEHARGGGEPAGAALDVEELLAADVRAKAYGRATRMR